MAMIRLARQRLCISSSDHLIDPRHEIDVRDRSRRRMKIGLLRACPASTAPCVTSAFSNEAQNRLAALLRMDKQGRMSFD
eukprot:scaffold7381_cov310-Pinguiococcus_pyrenoidosus.AAC.49